MQLVSGSNGGDSDVCNTTCLCLSVHSEQHELHTYSTREVKVGVGHWGCLPGHFGSWVWMKMELN